MSYGFVLDDSMPFMSMGLKGVSVSIFRSFNFEERFLVKEKKPANSNIDKT